MYSPTTRVLTVLEILQAHPGVSGPEIAAQLQVNVRSVRRYVTMLRDMGIPVESEPGRYGTYYLRPGFRLPPLMFTGAEILAIVLGLMTVRHLNFAGVSSATTKIERVLPDELHERAQALQAALSFNLPQAVASADDLIAQLSLAAYQQQQVRLAYGDTERVVDLYGLVYHNRFWYAVGYCHLRADVRIFRLDRVQGVRVLATTFAPVSDFDPLAYLLTKIAHIERTWSIEVLLKTTLDAAQRYIGRDFGVLEAVENGVRLRMLADDLAWVARTLLRFNCPFVVIEPPELREALKALARELVALAEGG